MNDKPILYIEDNAHNRRIVRKILSIRNYTVIESVDGLEGFAMIQKMHPPVVLLDISLPGIDGIEVVKRVKSNRELESIPVIALTASAMRGDRERFLEAGCDDYLSKPVRAMELLDMVEKYYFPNGQRDTLFDKTTNTPHETKEVETISDNEIAIKIKERMVLGKIPPSIPERIKC